MGDSNICKFPADERIDDSLRIWYFVYETNPEIMARRHTPDAYLVHLVVDGEGTLETEGTSFALRTGHVFFTFPHAAYRVVPSEGQGALQYLYVGFSGDRADRLMEQTHILPDAPPYAVGGTFMRNIWFHALNLANAGNVGLLGESVLLYTLAEIGNSMMSPLSYGRNDAILGIKKYVDAHYFEPSLTLRGVSEQFSYNHKYVSDVFRRKFGVGFSEYLTELRIRRACILMEQGFTYMKEVAHLCGFADPLYFSKVFRKTMGMSPREFADNLGEP